MFDFSHIIDLPLAWGIIIGLAIFFYVMLDGFDLGIGIIYPFAPTDKCRDKMMSSIAPFWDGNETWLVLGGGGLFAAFPLAYSILLPAFYIPIILMLLGLIMRGIAFEFRFKTQRKYRYLWDYSFHIGSVIATFCQGSILGAFIQGTEIEARDFVGDIFNWSTGFSVMTGIALLFGYTLLGSTWLIMKTDGTTQEWSRKVAKYALILVIIFMILVSISVPISNPIIGHFWFSVPNIYWLLPIPLLTGVFLIRIWLDMSHHHKRESRPFFLSIAVFAMGYLGLGISIYPWIIPFKYTIYEAAAYGPSLSLMFATVVPMLPIILGYTGYAYYVFRGKTDREHKHY